MGEEAQALRCEKPAQQATRLDVRQLTVMTESAPSSPEVEERALLHSSLQVGCHVLEEEKLSGLTFDDGACFLSASSSPFPTPGLPLGLESGKPKTQAHHQKTSDAGHTYAEYPQNMCMYREQELQWEQI